MKAAQQERLLGPQRPEATILDQIRNDRDLIDRLRITPAEIEVLSKCALLGTLTCKQDMLFILRQIREAGSNGVTQAIVVAQPALPDDQEKDFAPDVGRTPVDTARAIVPELGSLEGIVRRRLPEQFGVMFWVLVLAAGLAWSGAITLSQWKDKLATSIGAPAAQRLAPPAWYDKLDRFNVLFWLEILFIAGVALVIYLRSLRSSRRFKVKPGRSSRY